MTAGLPSGRSATTSPGEGAPPSGGRAAALAPPAGLSYDRRDLIVAWAFARLDAFAFALASAAVAGLALLALTLVIVLKGAPPGVPVGPHLAHLAAYFPGYTVTIPGAFLGAGYGAIAGAALGGLIALLWNCAHGIMLAFIRIAASLSAYRMD